MEQVGEENDESNAEGKTAVCLTSQDQRASEAEPRKNPFTACNIEQKSQKLKYYYYHVSKQES